jgi:hypothetical protein
VTPPDILVLGPEWPTRALLRAQLIEDGWDVVATDAWPIPRQFLRRAMRPRAIVVDLHGLPEPRLALDELRMVMDPARVLVLAALGTLTRDEIATMGFHVMERPASIGDIASAASALIRTAHAS